MGSAISVFSPRRGNNSGNAAVQRGPAPAIAPQPENNLGNAAGQRGPDPASVPEPENNLGNAAGQCGPDPANVPQPSQGTMLPPVTYRITTMAGNSHEVLLSPSERVASLKQVVAPLVAAKPYQVQITNGNEVLQHMWVLQEHGINESSDLLVVVGPGMPDFAAGWGFEPDLPQLIMDYAEKHRIDPPAWFQEGPDGMWVMLRKVRASSEEFCRSLRGYGHYVEMEVDGQKVGTLRAKPGAEVRFCLRGRIWNNNGDTCIHQLVLVCDNKVVAEVYDGVASYGRDINGDCSFIAPLEEGIYMLWKWSALQYSMRDAMTHFTNAYVEKTPTLAPFPEGFVGWLCVTGSVEAVAASPGAAGAEQEVAASPAVVQPDDYNRLIAEIDRAALLDFDSDDDF